MTSAVACITW